MGNTSTMRYLSYILELRITRIPPDCNKVNLCLLGFSEFFLRALYYSGEPKNREQCGTSQTFINGILQA
jgi:hypothetical protein